MRYTYEIYLTNKFVKPEDWRSLINHLNTFNKFFKKWYLFMRFEGNTVRYFTNTVCLLPPTINGVNSFILKETDLIAPDSTPLISAKYFAKPNENAVDIYNELKVKKKRQITGLQLEFKKAPFSDNKTHMYAYTTKNGINRTYALCSSSPEQLLSVNFEANYNLLFKKAPKYLDISKSLHILQSNPANALLEVNAFPYLQGWYFLDQNSINFDKHSVILGASGCGKSKFIGSLIKNINTSDIFNSRFRIVVIDPHASLENDIGGIGRTIDFRSLEDSINLFSNSNEDKVVSVELLLDIFKGLIPNGYNSKLERVLRHSLTLLLSVNKFNFTNLRNLILELEYHNQTILEAGDIIPQSVKEFFLTEFNDIKTKSYTDAISPIIALIDELEMIPVFNKMDIPTDLHETINDNFLTIFSLDRTKLGDKVAKLIAGLVMQQLLILAQNYTFSEHIIFIVDEVSVVENPILMRFLSESRKFNVSLILAGQHFSQISSSLKQSIFANVVNYYIFRLSQGDANELVDNINMKIPLDDTREQKVKFITDLQNRECIVRLLARDTLMPAIKCRTTDFTPHPRPPRTYTLTPPTPTYQPAPAPVKVKEEAFNTQHNQTNFSYNDYALGGQPDLFFEGSQGKEPPAPKTYCEGGPAPATHFTIGNTPPIRSNNIVPTQSTTDTYAQIREIAEKNAKNTQKIDKKSTSGFDFTAKPTVSLKDILITNSSARTGGEKDDR